MRRFKRCSYKAFFWWQLRINSPNPDSKFWVSSGPFAWLEGFCSEFPNGLFLCVRVRSHFCLILVTKAKKPNKQIIVRTFWNPSWLMVYFVLWDRASTSCSCSKKSFFSTVLLLGTEEEMRVKSAFASCGVKMQLLPEALKLISKTYPGKTLPNSGNHPAMYPTSFTEEALPWWV